MSEIQQLATARASALLSAPISADELEKWPLMHGTVAWAYEEKRENIRLTGLHCNKGNPNSFRPDSELGRTGYVFLAPSTFRFNYSFRTGGILVDPSILKLDGNLYCDQDAGSAFECLKIELDCGQYCGRGAKEVATLLAIARALPKQEDEFIDDLVSRAISTKAFGEYYIRNYHRSKGELFDSIVAHAAGKTLYEYFGRAPGWGLNEEISVPNSVRPEYLLGYCSGRTFTQWNEPSNPEAKERLHAWLVGLEKFDRENP